MLGLRNAYTNTQQNEGSRLKCVSAFVYTGGRGEMFLAAAQSGIRRAALPRTSLTLFCLFLAAVNRVNHRAALLAIAEKLPRAAAQLRSSHYVNKAPCRSGGQGSNRNTALGQRRALENKGSRKSEMGRNSVTAVLQMDY